MKRLIFTMIILCSLQGFSQTDQITTEMSTLIDKNVALFRGSEYQEYSKLEREFAKKTPVEISLSNFENEFEDWVTANLSKTQFKSVDEALDLFNRLMVSQTKFSNKVSELDDEQDHVIEQYADRDQFDEIFSNEFGKRLSASK